MGVRKREAAQVRAAALKGARGGRPPRDDRGATWRAVMQLIRRSEVGEDAAQLELQHIWSALGDHVRDRARSHIGGEEIQAAE